MRYIIDIRIVPWLVAQTCKRLFPSANFLCCYQFLRIEVHPDYFCQQIWCLVTCHNLPPELIKEDNLSGWMCTHTPRGIAVDIICSSQLLQVFKFGGEAWRTLLPPLQHKTEVWRSGEVQSTPIPSPALGWFQCSVQKQYRICTIITRTQVYLGKLTEVI